MTGKTDPVWLNLGCNDDIREGFINVDKPDFDLTEPLWPWTDSTVDYILARDIIEHLPNKILTINECWRVLKPGGILDIEVPTTDGRAAFQDPTHVSFWNRHSFWYFEKGNVYRERFARTYGIVAAFKVKHEQEIRSQDGPKLRIVLEAVK